MCIRDSGNSKIISEQVNFNKATCCPIELKAQPSAKYSYKGATTLVDGLKGGNSYAGGRWLGFWGTDVEATIHLGVPTEISKAVSYTHLEVKVSIEKPFDGVSSIGTTSSTTALDMPSNVSKSAFYGTTESSVIISGLYPGQAYDRNVFASGMNNTSTNSETVYSFKGENNGNASLNPTKNTANIATVQGIIADEKGRIYLTCLLYTSQ